MISRISFEDFSIEITLDAVILIIIIIITALEFSLGGSRPYASNKCT